VGPFTWHAKLQNGQKIWVERVRHRFLVFPQTWPLTCSKFVHPLAIYVPHLLSLLGLSIAGVAQLVEHLICNQRVGGSIPSASSTRLARGSEADRILSEKMNGLVSFDTSPFCVFACAAIRGRERILESEFAVLNIFAGRVGEWLKPADCKSAAPCGLRRFESFPVHHALAV
jgi:hypothetical protein